MTSLTNIIDRLRPADSCVQHIGQAFAGSNIALAKYWGKRDKKLNLPTNSSLSISLGSLGSRTQIQAIDAPQDRVVLNNRILEVESAFAVRLSGYLDWICPPNRPKFEVNTLNTIPTAAGLASSASGFAALTLALNKAYAWDLPLSSLSVLARIGSGSACRSIFEGFVKWDMGEKTDGSDSLALPLDVHWPEFRIGLLTLTEKSKKVDSRSGMNRTTATSILYQSWPQQAEADVTAIETAIRAKDFATLGPRVEHNAMSMHATMLSAWPPLVYWTPESLAQLQQIWQWREEGLEVFITMDAGPNIKLIFLQEDESELIARLPNLQVIAPFSAT
jgi:diphosphomevalonate decarboxylase